MRMPLPPPPAAGLISSGKPTSAARWANVAGSSSSIADGATGKPARATNSRARTLSPINSISSAPGPTNTSPALRTLRAKSAFSDRKP